MSLDSHHSDHRLSHEENPIIDKMEDNPLKLIRCLVVLAICLLAFHVQAEIYKYVDEEGNYHFTDDLNQVPPDQREAMEASQEYESDVDAKQGNVQAEPEQAAESEQAAGSVQGEETDPELESSYKDEPVETDTSDEKTEVKEEGEEESQVAADIPKDADDLDANRARLETMKKEIDNEYREILNEKKTLAKEKESLTNRGDILKYNAKVEELNKRAEAYVQKGKQYKEQVEAYNDLVTQRNAEVQHKKDKNVE
jgi:chromosome segregation ATPase